MGDGDRERRGGDGSREMRKWRQRQKEKEIMIGRDGASESTKRRLG